MWDGSNQVGEAQFGGASADNATSTLTRTVVVTAGETKTIVIKGDIITHDSNTNSNSTPGNGGYGAFLSLSYDGNANGLIGNYATGKDSGNTISGGTTSNQTTSGVRIFRNVPSLSVTSTGGTLGNGLDLYKFRVTNPDSNRDLVLKQVTLSVATTGSSVTGFTLYGDGVAANGSTVNIVGATGAQTVTISFDSTSNAKTVPAGSSKEYILRAGTVTVVTAAPASLCG